MQTAKPGAGPPPGVDAPKPQIPAQCYEVIDTLVQLVAELEREIVCLHWGHAGFQNVVQAAVLGWTG